jgi:hypothetical protein
MAVRTLSAMPYASARVVIDENGTTLTSYLTEVATIDKDGWLTINGLYSMTTRKHIGAFMREYTGHDYQTAKRIYENRERFNIFTGEVESL